MAQHLCSSFRRARKERGARFGWTGIRPGDRVALLSENRPEWSIADLAILSLERSTFPSTLPRPSSRLITFFPTPAREQCSFPLAGFTNTLQPVLATRPLEHLIFEPEVAEDIEHGISEQLEQNGSELAQQRPGALKLI